MNEQSHPPADECSQPPSSVTAYWCDTCGVFRWYYFSGHRVQGRLGANKCAGVPTPQIYRRDDT